MNNKLYWRVRKTVISLFFFFKKLKYSHIEREDNRTFAKALSLSIMKTIFIRLFLSFLIVIPIIGLDHIIIAKAAITPFDPDLYKELLLAGMGIAGVILGLYCANIASVFSARYSNVPKQIASDFQNDIITKSAIKEIIGYIVICTLTLMLCIAKISMTWISLSILAFLTIKMVVVFSVSGTRTYILSDTFRIADIHTNNINNAIRKISKTNGITSDVSFQHHIQKVCKKDISVLLEIAKFNMDIPATQNSAMCAFMDTNLILLGRYWQIKRYIPHNSKWFSEKTFYPQWHATSHIETDIAVRHGTSVECIKKPDPFWFEDSLLAVNNLCLDKLINDGDMQAIISYLQKLAALSSETTKSNTTTYWVQQLESLQHKIITFVENHKNEDSKSEDEIASLFDILASTFVEVLKSRNNELHSLDLIQILNHACSITNNYSADKNYYHFFNNSTCDSLYLQIATETQIEKRKITPNHFIKQTIAKQMYDYLGHLTNAVEHIINVYLNLSQSLHDKKMTYCAAVYLAHSFEVISNCEMILSHLESKLPVLEAQHIEKSYIWDQVSLQSAKSALTSLNKTAPALLVKNCGTFALRNWTNREAKPDFLGLCYNHLCEHLIRAIETNDYAKFESIYCDFFALSFLYQEYVRTDVVKKKEQHLQSIVVYAATDAFVECGIISGLATLWGEFISDNRWRKLVQITVDNFLDSDKEKKQSTFKYIVQVITGRNSLFVGVPDRSITQTNWETRIARAMYENEAFEVEYKEFGHKILKTNSKLLSAFSKSLFGDMLDFDHTEDVFYVIFINKYLENDEKYKSQSGWEEDFEDDSF